MIQNKLYITVYLSSIIITITNIIQSSLAINTGYFIETNPFGINCFLIIIFYLFMLIGFIKNTGYKKVFLIGIIYTIFLGMFCFVNDLIIIYL